MTAAHQLNTVDRARGRWREILPHFGLETRFLQNKHGPCPLCGGKDRYRFDDKNGAGTYYCNQCGAGVGIILVCKLLKCDHATACREIDKIIGNGEAPPREAGTVRKDETGKRRAAIERLLGEARDRTVVERYLAKRGLAGSSSVLRGHRACPYFDDNHKLVRRYPAVIAPILGRDGSLQSAIRIYDADVEPRKKNLPPVETIKGGAVRLFDPVDDKLAVGEGVETCLAVRELFNLPTWATLSDNGLIAFEPPANVKVLHVFGDNDSNYVGQTAAFALAKKAHALAQRQGRALKVEVWIPDDADTDWLDVLNAKRAAQ